MSADPFDKPKKGKGEQLPYARPEDGGLDYCWDGVLYRRVTAILDMAPGSYLNLWYGKMAAMSAAAPLVHAGLLIRANDTGEILEADDLDEFTIGQALHQMDDEEAIRLVGDWRHHMKEGERNRDHKGRIGTLTHHYLYEYAIGLRVDDADLIDWGIERIRKMRLLPTELVERYAAYGKKETTLERELSEAARPYIVNALAWQELFKPDDEATGLETAVFHEGELYAGTRDGVCVITKQNWEAAGKQWVFKKPTARVVKDYKTSRRLQKAYDFQCAAYARAEFVGMFEDQSKLEMEDVDGILIIHIRPGEEGCAYRMIHDDMDGQGMSGREKIDYLFEGFCGLSMFHRTYNDLPRSPRARKFSPQAKTTKGNREVPF